MCKDKIVLFSEPKINVVIKEAIEKKYPGLIKKLEEQKKETTSIPKSENKTIKWFCVNLPNFHVMPYQKMPVRLNERDFESFANILQLSNQCVVLTSYRGSQNELYGCLVEPTVIRLLHMNTPLAFIMGKSRVKATRIFEEYIETIGRVKLLLLMV